MSVLLFTAVLAIAAVLWTIAATINSRRGKLAPINRQHFEADGPSRAAPTMPARAAARWLAQTSAWGRGQDLDPDSELVGEQLVERLAAGDLTGWGRREPSSPLVRLLPAAFATGLLDLPADSLFIIDKDASYHDLQLNEDEVKRVWPA